MELKQVVKGNILMNYIEGLVNDYIQKEFSQLDDEEVVGLYMTVFNLVVSFNTILQNKNLATGDRIFNEINKFVDVEFKSFNNVINYTAQEVIDFKKNIYDLIVYCSKQDFTKYLKSFTIKKQCEKQDCNDCKCEK